MKNWSIALGFYQNPLVAHSVLKKIRKKGYSRSAFIYQSDEDVGRVDSATINRFKKIVIQDEALVLVQVDTENVQEVLSILRQVESSHPISFLLRIDINLVEGLTKKTDLSKEPLTLEHLGERAEKMAQSYRNVKIQKSNNQPLINKLKQSQEIIKIIQYHVEKAETIEQTTTSSAEWLLDNSYIIQGTIEEIKRNLPKKFYNELPVLVDTPMVGSPRVYAIAFDMINSTSSALNPENITTYLKHYEAICPITMGELWALPLMLRLRLIERIESLALEIDRRLIESELASFWGNRLLNVSKREPEKLEQFLKFLKEENPHPSPHFAEELLDHLFDEQLILPYVRLWLEEQFLTTAPQIIAEEQIRKTTEQVNFSNAIVSLIAFSRFSWLEIFENVNPVDKILNEDPSGIYPKMDFKTRDIYRHSIEMIAKRSKKEEVKIAQDVLSASFQGKDSVSKHVGYYLIDDGRPELEKAVGYQMPIKQKIRRWMMSHPTLTYLGSITLFTLFLESFLLVCLLHYFSLPKALLFLFLAFLPFSEIGIQFVNFFLTQILDPQTLPKMSFDEGIPKENQTLVVIPVMLCSEEAIKKNIEDLEIRYLANSDESLRFGLLSDYCDSLEEKMNSDEKLLKTAVNGIQELADKYGEGIFYLFHRNRLWSESEQAWIGEERKRGKLEELNQFLCNLNSNLSTHPHFILVGDAERLKNTHYIITLDADTQLPKDRAKKLIEVISHPLNKAYLNEKNEVKRGYAIIQPRVSTDFPQAQETLFSKFFSDPVGVDPYTQVISDVYQDLAREGSYHGKGIYDLQAFEKVLSGRFPKEKILSHDLIEGIYARVGFVSDVSLFDRFPSTYFEWAKRQHRWMRGDWQIIDWLFSKVPNGKNEKEPNPITSLNKWKILDNLRRALMPVALLLLLLAAWLFTFSKATLTFVVIAALFLPSITLFLCNILRHPKAASVIWQQFTYQLARTFTLIALMPYEAYNSVDALIRAFYRRYISHHHLLEWLSPNVSTQKEKAYWKLGLNSLFALLVFGACLLFHPPSLPYALPFCLLWLIAPLLVYYLDRPLNRKIDRQISNEDKKYLRKIARATWRFFDDFVGPQTNWLPPDNYQAALGVEVAQRTSPTNIGLWLLSIMTAYDFKFLTLDNLIDRANATLNTLNKLEKFAGHFLNWYEIQTLLPLYPRYISTVDSGNFIASIWTFEEGLYGLLYTPLLPKTLFDGLKEPARNVLREKHSQEYHVKFQKVLAFIENAPSETDLIIQHLRKINQDLEEFLVEQNDSDYWVSQLKKEVLNWLQIVDRYFTWIEVIGSLNDEELQLINPEALKWKSALLKASPSLLSLARDEWPRELHLFLENIHNATLSKETCEKLTKIKEAIEKSQWLANEKLQDASILLKGLNSISQNTDMNFLYDETRKVFTIGYNADTQRKDNSFYDLLASEARISSLVSIAKGDVPIKHWWALGRPYTYLNGRQVLLSWGGTMFEYLMPLIFNKHYPDSLLGQACEVAVSCQIEYGKKLGIPWGISEAAFSEIDARQTYQYRSFGVPGMGLKRDLENDLVVSPYSTGLALLVHPNAAIENFKKLEMETPHGLFNVYGYYESIDFTRQYAPKGERGVIIYAYMAHHQGMTFLALNNVLNEEVMSSRFHNDRRIAGVDFLLYERIPIAPYMVKGYRKEIPLARLAAFSTTPILGVVHTPFSPTPKINLLSNSEFSIMTTNSGGSYNRWKNIDVTRWRSDTTSDNWGKFYYIKDLDSQQIWSTTFQPTYKSGHQYSVSFKSDVSEFHRQDEQIETLTEVFVSPEDNAEIHLITLGNLSKNRRRLELTSYMELVLAPHATDRQHPAFNKLFIQTEAIARHSGLLAFRRLRSPDDQSIWAAHVIASDQESDKPFQFETDRAVFIGRGTTLEHPIALDKVLSNTEGTVLDPIFSLRYEVTLEPGQRVQVSFVTMISDNREKTVSLLEKYSDLSASHRSKDMAWTYAQLQLRHLRIHQEEVQLFQKLASRIIYPHSQLRCSAERLRQNRLGQSRLWKYGLSGDLPIMVVTVVDLHEIESVKQAMAAHAFWFLRGLKVDLLIINEEADGYEQPLFQQLYRLIHSQNHVPVEQSGGIFLKNSGQVPEDDFTLILSCANVVLNAARGSLRQQVVSPMQTTTYPPLLKPKPNAKEEPSKPLTFLELVDFNGLGGFTQDGKEYVIYLPPNVNTPLPWINVIANKNFGTLVSETGNGTTWYGNSQSNRLTPWSNDPILNPISDIIYIRDEDLGTFWSTTSSPIRELDPYRIRHGQGYTVFEHNSHAIEQELTVFVPANDADGLPIRIQQLRLTNTSSKKRYLSITSFSEWVLGTQKEETQMHIWTEWDAESQSLFARNYYNPDFSSHIAFASSFPPAKTYTADRTEFIGRNHTVSNPLGLKRRQLSCLSGTGFDPCAALQVHIEISPGETKEVIFFLGYAANTEEIRKLVSTCKKEGVNQLLIDTKKWWDKQLGTIEVQLPETTVNFALNHWLIYQSLSCRFWGRTGFYQSSGAYGFRDQLQDSLALVYSNPSLVREHILRAASRQFEEGDVQHWWQPPSGAGVRTMITDDLLWLPFAIAQYIRVTNDRTILNEIVPFIKGPLLTPSEHETYFIPEISTEKATLLEHCRRALNKSIETGPHHLPLIGGGDWNDGMNRVGIKGKGESVWLGWFLIHVMHDFAELLEIAGQSGDGYKAQAKRLAEIIEEQAWDGNWYRRAYFDDGEPIGSHENEEAIIDSLAQSWAIISGAGNPTRTDQALISVENHLIKSQEKIVLLLTPPFDHTPQDPGYIKGYPPGVRENGGQYTHGSLWVPLAFARKGFGDKAVDLLKMMTPFEHAKNLQDVQLYKVEPYAVAADIYSLTGHVGRGGWTWYTGSSAWMYRIWLEEILGFQLRGDELTIKPTIPKDWDRFYLRYIYHSSTYEITVENPSHINQGHISIELDQILLSESHISLVNDGKIHKVKITLYP